MRGQNQNENQWGGQPHETGTDAEMQTLSEKLEGIATAMASVGRGEPKEERWEITEPAIFGEFAMQLEEFFATGEMPESSDRNVQYALELQQKRLKEKQLELRYGLIPTGPHTKDCFPFTLTFGDDKYLNQVRSRSCQITRSFLRNGKKIWRKKEGAMFHQTTTVTRDGASVADDLYVCPNCGAVSSVRELRHGCHYCGTFFKMQDLFPKITNYFFLWDYSVNFDDKEEKRKYMIAVGIVAAVIFFCMGIAKGNNPVVCLLTALTCGTLVGIIDGFLIYVFVTFGSLFVTAYHGLKASGSVKNGQRRFRSLLRGYCPDFSYEYFSGKVTSLLRILLFSNGGENLPMYEGKALNGQFEDIVDISFSGTARLKHARIRNNRIVVTVDIHVECFYEKFGRIRKRKEIFRMKLYKCIDKPIDYNYSIHKIQCDKCGGSFDGMKFRTCPYCGTKYDVSKDDWVITDVKKMKCVLY